MPDEFVAIDFETANPRRHSVCQVGLAFFADGGLTETVSALINPLDDFDPRNIRIHNITPQMVVDQPTLAQFFHDARPRLENKIIVHHSTFDAEVFRAACSYYQIEPFPAIWLDTCQVARAAWPDLPNHRLKDLARRFAIPLNHHAAAEDARACGLILLKAIEHSAQPLSIWVSRYGAPIRPRQPQTRRSPAPPAAPAAARQTNVNQVSAIIAVSMLAVGSVLCLASSASNQAFTLPAILVGIGAVAGLVYLSTRNK